MIRDWLIRRLYGISLTIELCAMWWRRDKPHRSILQKLVLGGFVLMALYAIFFAAPLSFPTQTLLRVEQGRGVGEVARDLKERNIIHSVLLFELTEKLFGGRVVAGEYAFERPESVVAVARRLARGDYQLEPVKTVIPDGASAREIASILSIQLVDFDVTAFYAEARQKEGRLFPDTYFFLPGSEPSLIVSALENNFNEHVRAVPVATAIAAYGRPLDEVLTMASILEKEAPDTDSRRIIAGILWKRIAIGMPLQVDAVFPYIFAGGPYNLGKGDLKVDSPYNTYTNKGLPPGPIGSPSIDAIIAAVTPVETSYLYFLSDKKGNFHFASTFEQHVKNRQKYIGG